jgi:dockerin type I repeat protein
MCRDDGAGRLFGDGNGDGKVDARDLVRFLGSLGSHHGDPGYLWYLDYDGNGAVGVVDLVQFVHRLGK